MVVCPGRLRARSTWNSPRASTRAASSPRCPLINGGPSVAAARTFHVEQPVSSNTCSFISTRTPHQWWSVRRGPAHVPRGTPHEHQHAHLHLHHAASSMVVSPWRLLARSTWNSRERQPAPLRLRDAAAPTIRRPPRGGPMHVPRGTVPCTGEGLFVCPSPHQPWAALHRRTTDGAAALVPRGTPPPPPCPQHPRRKRMRASHGGGSSCRHDSQAPH